jgi:hypothetical protein
MTAGPAPMYKRASTARKRRATARRSMSTQKRWNLFIVLASVGLTVLGAASRCKADPAVTSAETQRWFQATEQELMDSIARGDKGPWQRVLDPSFVSTSEEGEVMTKQQFLDDLRPLPQGLIGSIAVKELTVQELPGFAVVRFLADEKETVFGQALATKYRITDTYRRAGESWLMVATHTSVVTADPPTLAVSGADWPDLVGKYRLLPDGWTFIVELDGGKLYGGRDAKKLRPLLPLTPDAFVVQGSLGEWIFVREKGKAVRILNFRKFEPLIWTRIDD